MKPFIPESLPLKNIAWDNLINVIGKANYNLAAFAGTLKAVVNPSVLLTPLTLKRQFCLQKSREHRQHYKKY